MPVILAKIKVGVGGQGDDDQIQPFVSKDLRNKLFYPRQSFDPPPSVYKEFDICFNSVHL